MVFTKTFYFVVLICHAVFMLLPAYDALAMNDFNPSVQKPQIDSVLSQGELTSRDPALIFPVRPLLDNFSLAQKLVFVDVRNKDDFQLFRIPGSINIPLYAIKTKQFLKAKKIVLVNEGYDYHSLEEECRKLQEHGFSAKILEGGLTYWRDLGGILEGDFFVREQVNEIPAQAFFADRDYDDWLVINAEKQIDSAGDNKISQAVNIPYAESGKDFVNKIRAAINEQRLERLPYILIVDDNGENYSVIKKTLLKAQIANVYYLQEGLQGYNNFLRDQALLLNPTRKTIEKCGSCP